MNTRGSSLIELLLYTGLLAIILAVLYQLFALAATRKLDEVVEDGLYVNASHVITDLTRTVQQATTIESPASGSSASSLSLNGGAIVYALDANNRLQKTEGGVTDFLTNSSVDFNSLSFTRRGPSPESQTVTVDFVLSGIHLVEGQEIASDFTTSVTVR
jgi:hypothetical protein